MVEVAVPLRGPVGVKLSCLSHSICWQSGWNIGALWDLGCAYATHSVYTDCDTVVQCFQRLWCASQSDRLQTVPSIQKVWTSTVGLITHNQWLRCCKQCSLPQHATGAHLHGGASDVLGWDRHTLTVLLDHVCLLTGSHARLQLVLSHLLQVSRQVVQGILAY
jgi:hypothetical protein